MIFCSTAMCIHFCSGPGPLSIRCPWLPCNTGRQSFGTKWKPLSIIITHSHLLFAVPGTRSCVFIAIHGFVRSSSLLRRRHTPNCRGHMRVFLVGCKLLVLETFRGNSIHDVGIQQITSNTQCIRVMQLIISSNQTSVTIFL